MPNKRLHWTVGSLKKELQKFYDDCLIEVDIGCGCCNSYGKGMKEGCVYRDKVKRFVPCVWLYCYAPPDGED